MGGCRVNLRDLGSGSRLTFGGGCWQVSGLAGKRCLRSRCWPITTACQGGLRHGHCGSWPRRAWWKWFLGGGPLRPSERSRSPGCAAATVGGSGFRGPWPAARGRSDAGRISPHRERVPLSLICRRHCQFLCRSTAPHAQPPATQGHQLGPLTPASSPACRVRIGYQTARHPRAGTSTADSPAFSARAGAGGGPAPATAGSIVTARMWPVPALRGRLVRSSPGRRQDLRSGSAPGRSKR